MAMSRAQMGKQIQSPPSKLSQKRKKKAAKKLKKELNVVSNKQRPAI
jgi:hypothetical protein